MINPTAKNPDVFYACGLHAKLRFDAFNRADAEIQNQYEKNQIKFQEKRELQSDLWQRCRKCNEYFAKDDVIWIVQYFRFSTDIQIALKKSFRMHRNCAVSEQMLYGVGKEIAKDEKLDIFS